MIKNTLDRITAIPQLTSLLSVRKVGDSLHLSLIETHKDLSRKIKVKSLVQIAYLPVSNSSLRLLTTELTTDLYHSPSKNTQVQFTTELSNDQFPSNRRFITISNLGGGRSVEVTKLHGNCYTDPYFSILGWREDTHLAYFAEALEQESDDKYCLKEDYGETYTGKKRTVLVLLDLLNDAITVIEKASGSSPIFHPTDLNLVYFVGIDTKLGLRSCTNRDTALYSVTLDKQEVTRVSSVGRTVRYPVITPDSKSILFLSNQILGPHDSSAELVLFDIASGLETVLVGKVNQSLDYSTFPGLFAGSLGANSMVYNSEGELLLHVTTAWRSRSVIISINLVTKEIRNLNTTDSDSWTYLGTFEDSIFGLQSNSGKPPALMVLKDSCWREVEQRPMADIPKSSHEIISIPGRGCNVEAIFIQQKAIKPRALVVMVHGGPHAAANTGYSSTVAAYLSFGFSVLNVNYNGSTGFGNDSIYALVGQAGSLDVEDVHSSVLYIQANHKFEKCFLNGGSHGGFINAHLGEMYPDVYHGSVIRNPVINIGSMPYNSDIPDWCFSELDMDYKGLMATPEQYQKMYEASPVKHSAGKTTPVLLLLGAVDRRVPNTQGLRWAESIKMRKGSVEVMYFPGNGHSLDGFEAERVTLERSVQFMLKILQ